MGIRTSGFLTQCDFGSREPNQCGSRRISFGSETLRRNSAGTRKLGSIHESIKLINLYSRIPSYYLHRVLQVCQNLSQATRMLTPIGLAGVARRRSKQRKEQINLIKSNKKTQNVLPNQAVTCRIGNLRTVRSL
jgi:hypothetical protein